MPDYGLTAAGFVPLTLPLLRDDLDAALRGAFGLSSDLGNQAPLGQISGILAERYALLWELVEVLANAGDPDAATNEQLDALASITGTLRNPQTYSAVTLTLTGTPATTVALGSRAQTASTLALFVTKAAAVIATVPAWIVTTPYVIGARVVNGGRVYQCITAGTSGTAPGPTGVAASVTEGTVSWTYLGQGTGAVDVAAEAQTAGPIVATSRDLTLIDTPVSGWSSVINLLDANVGALTESDGALRLRRTLELSQAGGSTGDAIRAALLELAGVTAATVFINSTDFTDVDGRPPHSFEALVQGGADAEIWQAILANTPAGIRSFGAVTTSIADASGTLQAVSFARPTAVLVYATLTVIKDALEYPVDGDAQIEAAIVAWGDAQKAGKDVVAVALAAQAFKVPGVLDVPTTYIGVAPAPGLSTTLAIGPRSLAIYDTSRITITSSSGTP